jgi:hypothetical protein
VHFFAPSRLYVKVFLFLGSFQYDHACLAYVRLGQYGKSTEQFNSRPIA